MAIPDIIKITARYLRKNQTVAETIFWNYFRRSTGKSKVYRQKPIAISIDNNNFQRYIIADFYFPQSKLIIEIDGEIHDNQDVYELDREKEVLLETQ